MPERIQLRRTKGWRMPEGAVKVDRSTKWGNPFVVGTPHPFVRGRVLDAEEASTLFEEFVMLAGTADIRRELAGKDLACWCPLDQPWCHAEVLLHIANAAPCTPQRPCPTRNEMHVLMWGECWSTPHEPSAVERQTRAQALALIANAYGIPPEVLLMSDEEFHYWLHNSEDGKAVLADAGGPT